MKYILTSLGTPVLIFLPLATISAGAASISVNFAPQASTVDNQGVDAGESSLVGVTGAETIDGANWNNIGLRPSNFGAATDFTAATQGGNQLDLIDSTGTDSGIDLTSSGSFYANYADVSTPNQGLTGDGGLMQGFLNLLDTESVTLSGLSTWAPDGYKVFAVFDIGPVNRTYAITVGDGTLSQTYWIADTAADSDLDNDGVISWLQTTATTSGTAVTDANYAVYGTFTGDTLTISGSNNGGRATLSGFQVVAVPETSSLLLGGLGSLLLLRRRR